MTTMKEIANKIDVSITTVSRVLNNDASLNVSADVRSKILKTASLMGYKTPRNRVRLMSSKRMAIAVVLWHEAKDLNENLNYTKVRNGIERLSIKSNINTLLVYKDDGEYKLDAIEGINGMICIGKFSREHIKSFENITTNIVFVDSNPNEQKYDSIMNDLNFAIRDVLSKLIDIGYKKIGYIGGEEIISTSVKLGQKKELVFRDYLYQRNLLEPKQVHIGSISSESGYKIMKKILKQKTHAEVYVCSTDSIALGALRAIHENGLRVPGDISLIGFNDDHTSKYTYPPLTSVNIYSEFMGEEALKSLIEVIDGRKISIKKVVPSKIVLRGTLK